MDDGDKVVFEGRGGPANVASTPAEKILQSLRDATVDMPPVNAVVGCFAGLLGSERHDAALAFLGAIAPGVMSEAYADFVGALAAAPERTDVVVISGTGSVVASWQKGQPVKSGGGGPLLGDHGSAFDVGRNALYELCISDRSYEASEQFWLRVESLFGTRDPYELPARVSSATAPARDLALLAGAVGDDFKNRRLYALSAVSGSMVTLGSEVEAHVDRFHADWTKVHVGLAGGLWEAHEVYETSFRKYLKAISDPKGGKSRQYHVERISNSAALGAAKLAKNLFYGN